MARRDQGTDAVYFDHVKDSACRDEKYHRGCNGRWVGALSLGRDGSGRRVRKKVTGQTKTQVLEKLKELRGELALGIATQPNYTVLNAQDDWIANALSGRAEKTVATQRELLKPLMDEIGAVKLRELTARQVRAALVKTSANRSSRTVRDARAALVRVITHAQANELVARNVAALVKPPEGQTTGRPSHALDMTQTLAVMQAATKDRLNAYFVLSLLTGVRTEEARALRWDHVVAYNEDTGKWAAVGLAGWDHQRFAIYVWRSVRSHGDVKTPKSRRTVALPTAVVAALRAHEDAQEKERADAGEMWQEHGLVFASEVGTPLDAANVRRSFRRICKAAEVGEHWSPRELRHTFVSIMSDNDVPIERIADLVGHTGGSRVTETVYRQVIRPVITTGAEVMDDILAPKKKPRRTVRRRGSAKLPG